MNTDNKSQRGFFKYVLFIDVETSGLFYNAVDPSYDPVSEREYQIVSLGAVVADSETFQRVDQLYVEIMWNQKSEWSLDAQKIHRLYPSYLEKNGLTEEQAVVEIVEFIQKYWGVDGVVCVGGQNVATFDLPFLRRLLTSHGIHVKFGSRVIDTNTLGVVVYNAYNSDQLFDLVGIDNRDTHNALQDAEAARKVAAMTNKLFSKMLK